MPFRLSRSLLWFLVAGGVAFFVDIGVLSLLSASLGVYAARAISFWLAASTTWLINRNISFANRPARTSVIAEYLRYLGLMLGGGAVNFLVYALLAWQLPQEPQWLILYVAAGTIAGMAFNYLGMSRFLYTSSAPP